MMDATAIPLALYLHLPWCVQKCPYCDFNSHTAATGPALGDQQQRYIEALHRDIALQAPFAAGRPIVSVFIGGGTPSLFTPAQIGGILDACHRYFDIAPDTEITMEANPGTLEHGSFAGYRAAGVNRLSIGAQSFDAEMLTRLGRLHGPHDTRVAVDKARRAGFDRINIDLMYGLPTQRVAGAVADVAAALALGVTHISHYQLTLEPNTRFHANPPTLPDDDTIADMTGATDTMFADAGFVRYEISALGRDGHRCAHNLNYWEFGDYLAIGAGAHGKLTNAEGVSRFRRLSHPRSYITAMAARDVALALQPLSPAELVFEFMLNASRLSDGFTLQRFEQRTGLHRDSLRPGLDEAASQGLLEAADAQHWRPTDAGLRFNNSLQMLFLSN